MEKKGRFKKKISGLAAILLPALLGMAAGVALANYGEHVAADVGGFRLALIMLLSVLCLALAVLLQMLIHEAGHLLFGLLSGYSFCSFRLGSFMLLKDETGRFSIKRQSIPGTGGQCLMSPPDFEEDGYLPTGLYNMGGVLLNFISALFFLWVYFLSGGTMVLPVLWLSLSIIGFGLALINGIPMQLGGICNDGYNSLAMGRDPAALRAFWIQLKINQLFTQGKRLGEMPWEWFKMPDEQEMKNSLCASLSVFRANRLMDEHSFAEAGTLMERLLTGGGNIPGLYILMLRCDLACCCLLSGRAGEAKALLEDKSMKKFMAQMKNYPAVIRTGFIWALLGEGDRPQAEKRRQSLEELAGPYPYPGDIKSEREIIALAAEAFENRTAGADLKQS